MTERNPLLVAAMGLGLDSEAEAEQWLDSWMGQHNPALGCRPAQKPEGAERLLRMIGQGVYV